MTEEGKPMLVLEVSPRSTIVHSLFRRIGGRFNPSMTTGQDSVRFSKLFTESGYVEGG
jgi:hypothetical protein